MNTFTYQWPIPECQNSSKHTLSETIDIVNIGNEEEFTGVLSIVGNRCSERRCTFLLQSKTHFIWKVYVKLYPLNGPVNLRSAAILNEIDDCREVKLYDPTSWGCLLAGVNIITCEVEFLAYKKLQPTITPINKFTLNDSLLELMKSQKYWDVTLTVDGHEMYAYKGILASRSKVFAAMFEHQLEEAKSNKVTITDIKFDVFEQILLYIYTDRVEKLNEMTHELLAASDLYDLADLKIRCENALMENLDVINAAETLILADLYRAEKLKKHTIDFISKNNKAVVDTEGFNMIKDNKHSHLLLELYLKIVK